MIATRWEKQSVFINNSVKDDDHRLSPEFALSFREFHGELIVQLTYQLWFGGGGLSAKQYIFNFNFCTVSGISRCGHSLILIC